MSEIMAEIPLTPRANQPVDHVIPDIYIRHRSLAIEVKPDMTVSIGNGSGRIVLSQQEFLDLLSWQQHIVHRDWGE